jgi:hypothetical protein
MFILSCWQAAIAGGSGSGPRTPDNNDTLATAFAITPGIPINDSVNESDDQYDFYKVTGVMAGQTLKASVAYTDPSAELNLSIRDPSGNNITAVSGGGLVRGDTALAPFNGTYYIEVKAHAGASGYTLNVTAAFPPILQPDAQVGGNLSTDAADRTDFYRFWLDANISGRREVGLLCMTQSDQRALIGAAFLDILEDNGSHVYNESWNISRKASLSAAAAYTGWYYCQVHAVWGTSGYALNLSRSRASSDGDNDPANATHAPLDAFFNGHVAKAADHYDWYSYRVDANDNLHIEVKRGNSTDGYKVTVRDSDLTLVQGVDNWNGSATVDNITIDLVPVLFNMTYLVAVEAGTAFRAVPLLQWTDDESSMDYNLSFTSPNHPPQIIAPFDNLTMKEDTNAHLIMASHFRDPDGDMLKFFTNAGYITGTYICASGELELTPRPNWNGKETKYITADDGRGAQNQAVLFVTVEPVEDQPFVKKGMADIQMLQGGTDLSLDLSAVFADNDTPYGDSLSYSVQDNGSIMVDIQPSGKVRLECMPDFFGVVTMQFTATDNASGAVSSPCNVTVGHVNRPPIVKRGPPGVRLLEDQGVVLDLSAVFEDPDGDPITMTVSGNVLIEVTTSGTNATLRPKHDASGFTEFIKFTASDDSGLGDAFVIVNVTVAPVNDPPRIGSFSPAGDVVMPENQSQQFTILASDVESGEAVNITWYLDGARTLGGVTTYLLRTNYSSAGVHNVTVVVDDGELAAIMVWNVTVQGENRAPQDLKIKSPRQGDIYKEGAPVIFDGSAADPDGDTLTLTWYEGTTELGRGSRLTQVMPSGSHSIFMVASDGGLEVRTVPLSFLVKRNSPPMMLSLEPATGQSFETGAVIRFSAEFSDADGDALSYCWTEGGRLLSSSQSFNRTDLAAGKHTVRLAVSDGTEVVATNVTIDVVQPGVLPGPGLLAAAFAGSVALVAVAVLLLRRRKPPGAAPVNVPPA